MAGRVAVGIADRLIAGSHVVLDEDGGQVTRAGRAFLEGIGVSLRSASGRRVFCRPCLDWSERRPHLAGVVGAALLDYALERDWLRRVPDGRALSVTPAGRQGDTVGEVGWAGVDGYAAVVHPAGDPPCRSGPARSSLCRRGRRASPAPPSARATRS